MTAVSGPDREVVHACPPGDTGFTPCCDRTPFELDPRSRMTVDPALVTCGVVSGPDRAWLDALSAPSAPPGTPRHVPTGARGVTGRSRQGIGNDDGGATP